LQRIIIKKLPASSVLPGLVSRVLLLYDINKGSENMPMPFLSAIQKVMRVPAAILVMGNVVVAQEAASAQEGAVQMGAIQASPVNESTTPPSAASQPRPSDVYNVRAGDTLWDISKTLFGDGFFWSKIWAANKSIENPHHILAGRVIRLNAGTDSEAPSVVVDGEIKSRGVASVETENRENSTEVSGFDPMVATDSLVKIDIPAPSLHSPVIEGLPSSFVSKQMEEQSQFDATGFSVGTRSAQVVPATIIVNSFIIDLALPIVGTVEEVETGDQVAVSGQNVFIKLSRSAQNGDRLSAVSIRSDEGVIKKSKSNLLKGSKKSVIDVGGSVEITAVVNEEKMIYKARVTESLNAISLKSVLIDEVLPRVSLDFKGPHNSTEAVVVGGEHDNQRHLLGPGSIVYLSGGSSSGINTGDIMAVQARRGDHREGTKFPDWTKPIALVKIAKTLDSVATAVVLRADEEIIPGDRTGANFPEVGQ
jgi:hypothetical protein